MLFLVFVCADMASFPDAVRQGQELYAGGARHGQTEHQ